MARPEDNPLDQRVQVNPQIQSPGLEVTASPVNTVGVPQAGMDQQVNEFTRSMAAFTQGFDGIAQQQSSKMIEQEQQKALKDNITDYDPAKAPVFTMDQTPFYTEARLGLWAQRKAVDLSNDMKEQYQKLQEDPDTFASTDITKWTQGHIQENLKGLTDPVVIQNVMGNLAKTQAEILGEATHKQEVVRNKKMLSDFGTVAETSLVNDGYTPESLDKLVQDAKAKHIPVPSIVPYIVSAARYGLGKGNYNAGSLLDTKLPSLNGLSLRMTASLQDQPEIDSLLGKAQPEVDKQKLQMFTENSGNALGKDYSDEALQDWFVKGTQLGLKRKDIVDTFVSHIKSLQATGDLSEAEAAQAINKPRAFLDGGNILNATSEKGSADSLNSQAASAQQKAANEVLAQKRAMFEADIEKKLASDDPVAAGLPLNNDAALAKMTFGNSMYAKEPDRAKALYTKLYTQGQANQKDQAAMVAWNAGQGKQFALNNSESDVKGIALKADQADMKSGMAEPDRYRSMIQRGVTNGYPSPVIKSMLGGISTMDATIKDSQGQTIPNPALQKALVIMDAIRKSSNPQALSQYLQGPDLAFANAIDVQTNEMGVSLDKAVQNAKLWSEPTHAEQNKRLVAEHRSAILQQVVGAISRVTDDGSQTIFGTTDIHNVGAISTMANDLIPVHLAANGGNVDATAKSVIKEIQQRTIGVTTDKNVFEHNDGYAIVLPPEYTASKETAKAFQAFQDKQAALYKGQGDVLVVQSNMSRGDAQYQVMVGGIPQGNPVSLKDILGAQTDATAKKATMDMMTAQGINPEAQKLAMGDLTPQAYQKLQNKKVQDSLNTVSSMMATTAPVTKDIQGNPVGPVIKGTGPQSDYHIAADNAVTNPAFAIGAAVEGVSQRAYKDNDGGITIGLGYNTKHQSMATIKSDFAKAGIPNTDGFISSIMSGEAALTLPQQQALHGVAFKRYQDGARQVFDSKYPGAYENLDKYQQAAIGQLAYNTGWNSKVMNKFLDKVGSGHEEDAIRDLRIVWHDKSGGEHVNTDMMRLVRAMYHGPDAFKTALNMGR